MRRDDGATFNLNRYDAIVSRNRNALGLAMLSYVDAAGIPAINTHAATQRVRNKAKMAIALGRVTGSHLSSRQPTGTTARGCA